MRLTSARATGLNVFIFFEFLSIDIKILSGVIYSQTWVGCDVLHVRM